MTAQCVNLLVYRLSDWRDLIDSFGCTTATLLSMASRLNFYSAREGEEPVIWVIFSHCDKCGELYYYDDSWSGPNGTAIF